MALTETIEYDKIEVVGQYKNIQVRKATVIKKDGKEIEVRMIDENDILLTSDEEPAHNRKQAGYVNTGGMDQMTSLPGND